MNIAAKPNPETVKKVNKANRAIVIHSDPHEHIIRRRGKGKK